MSARHVVAVPPNSALYETYTANAYGWTQAYAALSQAGVAWPGGSPGGPPIAAPRRLNLPPTLPARRRRRRPFGGRLPRRVRR